MSNEKTASKGVGSTGGSAIYTQREHFVIRYQGITGQTMYVVEVGETYEEWSRNVRASNKLSSAKRYTLHDAAMELEKVREVQTKAELYALEYDGEKCESGCDAPVVGHDSEGIPLCKECLDDLEREDENGSSPNVRNQPRDE